LLITTTHTLLQPTMTSNCGAGATVLLRVREYDEDPSRSADAHQQSEASRNGALESPPRPPRRENYHEYVVRSTAATITNANVAAATKTTTSASSSSSTASVTRIASNRRRRYAQAPVRVVKELFLPVGYPGSVNDGYLRYQWYDSLQGLSSYLRGVLCSAQVLEAAGVGRADATALSAATTWAMKDGLSMLGGLLFSYVSSPLLDSHVKEFRLFADLVNDVGLTLDMLAPYFPNQLLLVASLAGLCKTLCGISAGATKGSITLHFALEGNMADLNAKEATQETLVSLVGMILGVFIANLLRNIESGKQQQLRQVVDELGQGEGTCSDNDVLVWRIQWTIFTLLTLLHVWANWKGVQLLRMRTLNRERTELVLSNVLDELQAMEGTGSSPTSSPARSVGLVALRARSRRLSSAVRDVPAPEKVHESLLASTWKLLWPLGRLRLTAQLTDLLQCDLTGLTEIFERERYVIGLNTRNQVLVSLLVGATAQDQLKAFLHAQYLVRCTVSSLAASSLGDRRELLRRTLKRVNQVFSSSTGTSETGIDESSSCNLMRDLKRKGWEDDRLYLGFSRRRSQWTVEKTE